MRLIRHISLLFLWFAYPAFGQVDVTTANYGLERTNANLKETTLTPAVVTPTTFGKIGAFPVDGQIYAQPLYLSGLSVAGRGSRNVVFAVTMHNSVYAIDADLLTSGTPIWHVNLGPSIPSSQFNFSDISPEIGILSTPVIDRSRNALYVVAATFENGNCMYRLHALNLTNGQEILGGPAVIGATVSGQASDADDGKVVFGAGDHLQRPGLLLLNGVVYAAFGSHADTWPYHGWLLGYDASNLPNQVMVYNTAPDADGGSIWQSGRAPAADTAGNIYVITGNGDYDGKTNFGESFLKLSPKGTVLDWFTPDNWQSLSEGDYDLGSTGAALIPGTDLVFGGNKFGTAFLLHSGAMGKLNSGGSNGVQTMQPVAWGGVFNFAVWPSDNGTFLYLLEQGGFLKSFQLVNGQFNASPYSQSTVYFDIPYEGLAVSSNGGKPSSGIVWMTIGDHTVRPAAGSLHAFDPNNLQELWNSDMSQTRDTLGLFAKFVAPTVANGKVFVPTFSNQLVVYGIMSGNLGDPQAPVMSAVVNAASYDGDAISPGEVISIFGDQLGPAGTVSATIDATGHLPTSLAGFRVSFNGHLAPLLYISNNQIGAIVPWDISGPTAQVQIQSGASISNTFLLDVAPSTPAIFSADSSGGGQIAALNQDTSLNSPDSPADPGSILVFYATGAGVTDPASADGAVTAGTLPVPHLPVSVQIDGRDAQVLYAGAAPGLVSGVLQVNVAVPDGTSSGPSVSILLKVGDQVSQPGSTIAIK